MAQGVRGASAYWKKRDFDSTPETSEPPAFAAKAKDYQVTDFFMSQYCLEASKKLSSLVAPKNIDDMKLMDIRNDFINYFKLQERLVVAELTGFLQMSQGAEKADTDYLARLWEAARTASLSISKLLWILKLKWSDYNESKLKLLDSIRANDNLTLEEFLQLIP